MWHEILDEKDLKNFMEEVCFFHDSCIKEMKYVSGAYVSENLAMHPINDFRILSVVIQRQFKDLSMIEMQFEGLRYLKLFPADVRYTCEILDATLMLKDGFIYFCDCGGVSPEAFDSYDGTAICASKLRWRAIDRRMGSEEFYLSAE